MRRKGITTQGRDGMLIRPVVIHGPDLLVSGPRTDKVDLGLRDSVDSASQAENDFVGELMSDDPRLLRSGGVGVLLCQDLRRCRVLYVVQPSRNRKVIATRAQVSENQERGTYGGSTPRLKLHIRR